MRKFVTYSIAVVFLVMAVMTLLDVVYTYVYTHSVPRNKFQYIMGLKPQKIDYVFLGSSRTANHVATTDVIKMTGKSAVNLGIEGAVFEDNLLQLQLLIDKKIKISTLFLQVDYLYENEGISNIANAEALPFIHNPIINSHLKEHLKEYNAMYYVPFYRYMATDYRIGFREFVFSIMNKKPRIDLKDGFSPKFGRQKLEPLSLPVTIREENKTIEEIAYLCKANHIRLVLFCAPFCSATKNKEYLIKLKTKLPGLYDFSTSLDDKFFNNCGHLNDEGAKVFTKMLMEECVIN